MVFVSRYSEYSEAAHEESSFFYGRAKRVSLHVKTSRVEQGGVFRLARVVLSVAIAAPRPIGRICRRTEPPRRGRAFEKFSIFLLFSFFFFIFFFLFSFLGGWEALIGAGFQAYFGQKVRQSRTKSASISDKKCVNLGQKVRHIFGQN